MTNTAKITWTASNNSSFLNGSRSAVSTLAAVRAAREYIRGELFGEGTATIFVNGQPIKETERSIFTQYQWVTRDI